MKYELPNGMREAIRLTRTGRLTEATAAIQHLLGGTSLSETAPAAPPNGPPTIDGVAEEIGMTDFNPTPPASGDRHRTSSPEHARAPVNPFRSRVFTDRGDLPAPSSVPEGQFLSATFSGGAGTRPYRLYVPGGYRPGQAVPLIVMLHGCTQSPEDFAAGTRMNEAGEAHTCLIAYPGQTRAANAQKCWNWFNEKDQRREGGEAALIAGITREIMRGYSVDPRRVYAAGLSAGGAAAAIMGDVYSDLFAAIGVHSGLACGAARDMTSAFAAMKQGGAGRGAAGGGVPVIVFHGDADTTVNPRNGDAVGAQATRDSVVRCRTEEGQVPGGHAWRRTLHVDARGQTVVEQWVVHGAGHAWSGGSPAGSFTDPRGPDASKEMLRFFLEHPR